MRILRGPTRPDIRYRTTNSCYLRYPSTGRSVLRRGGDVRAERANVRPRTSASLGLAGVLQNVPFDRLPENTADPTLKFSPSLRRDAGDTNQISIGRVLLYYATVSGLSVPVFIPFLKTDSLTEYYAYCIHFASAGRLTADG